MLLLLEAELGDQLKLIELELPVDNVKKLQLIEGAIAQRFELDHGSFSLGYFDDEGDLCVLSSVTLPDLMLLAADSLKHFPVAPRLLVNHKPIAQKSLRDSPVSHSAGDTTESGHASADLLSCAEDELRKAMCHPEAVEDLTRALSLAVHLGAPVQLVKQAEQLLQKGGRVALEESLALRLFAAGVSQGTWRHRVLVPLLSSFFTSPSSSGSLTLSSLLDFLPESSRAFSLVPQSYGTRGGRPYFKPVGWLRFSLRRADFDHYKDWCVAYHGSQGENVLSILAQGLKCPQSSRDVRHGQAGGTGSTIYLSPSIEYAAHPVYSPLIRLGPEHWAQLIIECRVAPWALRRQGRTLPPHMWPVDLPFDQCFPLGTRLEWLVEDPAAVVVTGLMIREFGRGAASDGIYGDAACRVTQGTRGASVEWGHLRVKELRRLLYGKRPNLSMFWQRQAQQQLVSAA